MPVDPKYRMKILESKRTLKTEKRPRRPAKVNVRPSTQQIVRAFKKAPGYEEIVSSIPKAASVKGWEEGTLVGWFCVCSKFGVARYLDIWDCDHFDLVTDMQHNLNDCRAWFSHQGYTTWGSGQTATGRINCYFNVADAGDYSCVAQLQSDPTTAGATVECLIDNQSFGNLPFTGMIIQPHFCVLSAGGHHFRIRQVSGAFYFLSVHVFHF